MASNDTPFNKQNKQQNTSNDNTSSNEKSAPKQNHGFEQHMTRLIQYLSSRGLILQEEATDMIASMNVDTVSHKAGTEKVYDDNGVVSVKEVNSKNES